jgi:hypothetical protein
MSSVNGPSITIVESGPYTLPACSSEDASSWINGPGRRRPIGSPGSYSNSQPQLQPLSSHL